MSHWAVGHDHHIAAKAAGEAAANVQADSPGKAKGRCSRPGAALLTPRPPGRIPGKPSLPMKPTVSAAALISAVALSAPARNFRPDMSFENVPAGDESIQQCLVFPTTPGVGYRVEWSHDLTDWTTDEEVYGLGFDFVVAMREFTPPPPPPEPGSGDPPPLYHQS